MAQSVAQKYIKVRSLTWWASVTPLGLGLFLAFEPMHGLTQWVEVINTATGGIHPAVLINAGLAGIGMRGAVE